MLYDISRELFSAQTYPGDTKPRFRRVSDIAAGGECTLSDVELCAHNATHMDAPSHFVGGGKTIEKISLSRCVGRCAVRAFAGEVGAAELAGISAERLLLKGNCSLTAAGAAYAAQKFLLVGTELLSAGDAEIHKILLGAEVAVLEGLDLSAVPEGEYELIALPAKWGGLDGAPVRAVLRTAD